MDIILLKRIYNNTCYKEVSIEHIMNNKNTFEIHAWELMALAFENTMPAFDNSDGFLPSFQRITYFHVRKAPKISLYDYLSRIYEYAECSESSFFLAFIYIDRILQKNPDFILGYRCIHRLILEQYY